jgi:S-methylmethionine-dependent homocysteine/selenocysteine methylase
MTKITLLDGGMGRELRARGILAQPSIRTRTPSGFSLWIS